LKALGCKSIKRRISLWSRIKSVASTVGSGLAAAKSFVVKTATKAAKMGEKVMTKYGGVIKGAACKVIKQYCVPLCVKAGVYVKSAIKKYKISPKCLQGAFKTGCSTLCKTVCGKRRLRVRRKKEM